MSTAEAGFPWILCIIGEKGRHCQMLVQLELDGSPRIGGCFSSATQSSISGRRCTMKLSLNEPVKNIKRLWTILFVFFLFQF